MNFVYPLLDAREGWCCPKSRLTQCKTCSGCKMGAAMMAEIAISSSTGEHLRRLDMRRDLAKVADLVELCFFDTLDPDGRQYLNEMRRAAQNASMMRFASSLIDKSPMLPSGYVWEEGGILVGNLSLIPITVKGKRGYMIANVATHPDYRARDCHSAHRHSLTACPRTWSR